MVKKSGLHLPILLSGLWLAARTDTSHKHKGISVFLVPMDDPGITVHPY